MPNAPSKRYHSSAGNGCALIVCDSRREEHLQIHETVYAALGHFGIPYRVHDLAAADLDAATLEACAVTILGQDNMGPGLTATSQSALLDAVSGGLGMVNLDYNLMQYDRSLINATGLAAVRAGRPMAVGSTASVGIPAADHWITWTQEAGRVHQLNMPVPAALAKVKGRETQILAETDIGGPAVVSTRLGKGRIVQWLLSHRIWTLQAFGHAHGLDDIFWKGIVWAARKPFAMLCIPPFVRFRFDDCNGLYRTPKDMAFVDEFARRGHKPNMCVSMNALTDDGWRFLKKHYDAGTAEVAPHTWEGGVSLYYGKDGKAYSKKQFNKLIRETASMMRRQKIVPSKILSDHEHEYSSNVLPYLKQLGIEYKMNVMLPDEKWAGIHTDWKPAPYGSMSYALDYTPGPYPLFVVFNHYPAFDHARSYLSPTRFLLNRAGGYGAHMWDFLNGLTTRDLPKNDVKTMADRLVDHTRLGLNSLFFGGSISHSHFSCALSKADWKAVLDRYEKCTERLEKINVGYDDVAIYARSKFHTRVTVSTRLADGAMTVRLAGKADVPLKLSVFDEKGDAPERRYIDGVPFDGRFEFQVSARP
ncbi:hypothetical protein OAJ57_01680 [Alphaproteobacteria bacterium]|nr:hypothetical protein [Alphaproteobacteria bacterium]